MKILLQRSFFKKQPCIIKKKSYDTNLLHLTRFEMPQEMKLLIVFIIMFFLMLFVIF